MKKNLFIVTLIIVLSWSFTGYAGESTNTSIDKELKTIWGSMINRLSARDIEGALGYFTYSSRWRYKEEFTLIEEKLPEIFSKMREIESVYIKDDEAKYRVRIRNTHDEYTQYIWFRKDIFGRWKIDKF
ncbi:MAG: hypothetical protein AABY41_08845 [Nitrospirota bacterium]